MHLSGSERRRSALSAGQGAAKDDQAGQTDVTQDFSASSDSDTLSLEARNEKIVQANPDRITSDAQLGVQKAEAAALVWSKKTVYLTYGW